MALNDLGSSGITREEEYFYRRNQELIEKKRSELDRLRHERESEERKTLHWMKCPKCGGQMEEVDMVHIKVDRCSHCHGIYFDQGELETLMEAQEPTGFLTALRRLF
jgi:hypothetical protein